MHTVNRFVVSFVCLLLSMQVSAVALNPDSVALNPDYVNKKVYLNADGSGVIRTLDNHIERFFWLFDLDTRMEIMNCPMQTDSVLSDPTIYVKTIGAEDCYLSPKYKAGAIVSVVFAFTSHGTNHTLCLLDPAKPGKADCGKGYKPLTKNALASTYLPPAIVKK
ncbi:hypothetical protein [Bathymodiolus thermophilus thioautotrophic gill symbiont]|uniref:Uncharacterized protein n=1 Tax=Bathymodiolus thermophilus thioautotrophic gill symbiont TaxID=2360 RepID=A0A1J5TXW7_9GAMM|nr:hypothetical protein [Bathymodiolus thermophilus thioautotrophic gill symbiont]OIR25594.1 hypothetical protein BGC33_07160 [Bathymodiolus thermophilus thioautotrophic gill symbiont]CAB5499833.1 hypothetical protein THERMOS_1099 [Bathymodiolus thermophilus thioautotrophic gill symbiont]